MNRLENLILTLEFTEAKSIINSLTEKEIEDELLEVAFNTQSIVTYSFILNLIIENETASLHYIASVLLSQPLCHIDGAYQSAFFHAKKAIELDEDNIGLYEYILFFNIIPGKLLTDQEATVIENKINELKRLK
ncbi:hypothetical protein ACQKM9_19620 [Viridibacillus sp. NPDC093762]|uniref:hypothetical protein n=1 Tax=Viridibacillus sp. NPDC093762 TaxID=3390720 RepID=UPI003CFFF67F